MGTWTKILGLLAAILVLITAAIELCGSLEGPATPQPPTGARSDFNACPGEASDSSGNRVTYELWILPNLHSWRYQSWHELERSGVLVDAREIIRQPGNATQISGAIEIIAVGTASSEGNMESERRRAYCRAESTLAWLQAAASLPKYQHLLSLGKHTPTDAKASARQRPFAFILVLERDPDTSLLEALRGETIGPSGLIDAEKYSHFEFFRADAETVGFTCTPQQ